MINNCPGRRQVMRDRETIDQAIDRVKEEMREFGCSELVIKKLAWKILELECHPGGFRQGLIEDSPALAEKISRGSFRRQ